MKDTKDQGAHRSCIACDEIYIGRGECPLCGEPGELLDEDDVDTIVPPGALDYRGQP